jgi:arylsulfatase A-like enzyme
MVDWFPTLLRLGGAKAEQGLPVDGRDIWPTLTRGRPSPHDAILLNTTPNAGAVRAGDWKLIVRRGTDDPDDASAIGDGKESVELFNLRDDPYEKTNLAAKHPEKVKDLRATLAGFAKQAAPPKARPRPGDFVSPKVWGERD